MPRYNAEQLARAAAAGEPKAASDFAAASEWQAYQTEWLGIFSPDEQVPAVGDPQRRAVWHAATRQYKKMAAQSEADSKFAASLVDGTRQLVLSASILGSQARPAPDDQASTDALASSDPVPQSEHDLTLSSSIVSEKHAPSSARSGAVAVEGIASPTEACPATCPANALHHAATGLGIQGWPFMGDTATSGAVASGATAGGAEAGSEGASGEAASGATTSTAPLFTVGSPGPPIQMMRRPRKARTELMNALDRAATSSVVNESSVLNEAPMNAKMYVGAIALCHDYEPLDEGRLFGQLPSNVRPFVLAMEPVLNHRLELLGEINQRLALEAYEANCTAPRTSEYPRHFLLAPTQQEDFSGEMAVYRLKGTTWGDFNDMIHEFSILSWQELESYLVDGVVPASVAALEREQAEAAAAAVEKATAAAAAAAAVKEAEQANAQALLQQLLNALPQGELGNDKKKVLQAAIDSGSRMLSALRVPYPYAYSGGFIPRGPYPNAQISREPLLSGITDNLLVCASRWGRVETVKYLLGLRANVNKPNGFGDSPLMAAAINGQVEVVRTLMDAGADVYASHPEVGRGFTVLVAAVQRCSWKFGAEAEQRDGVKELVLYGQLKVVRCLLEEYKVDLKPAGLYGAPLLQLQYHSREYHCPYK